MLKTIPLRVIPLLLCLGLSACAGPAVRGPLSIDHPDCRISGEAPARADTIQVALLQPVRPERAPRPDNAAEQLLFGHLYETLIAVDCRGEVKPGLAGSWRSRHQGRLWVFELRPEATFSDGSPVSARDVAASWQQFSPELVNPVTGIDSFKAASDGEFCVYFSRPHSRVPRLLANPDFAVAKPDRYSVWPLSTGPYRTLSRRYGDHPRGHRRIQIQTADNPDGPLITFTETLDYDSRDLLERGIDLIVTSDPAVIDYSSGQSRFETTALPWDHMYLLLDTGRIEALQRGERPGNITPALKAALARDAVRSEARGAEPPDWWDRVNGCFDEADPPGRVPPYPAGAEVNDRDRRIVYDSTDPVARDLAERLAALAAADPALSAEAAALIQAAPGLSAGAGALTAEGQLPEALRRCLRRGEETAYVIKLDRRPYDFCYEIRLMIELAPWLTGRPGNLRAALLPLVDTRAVAIRAAHKVDMVIDGNVSIRITTGFEQTEQNQ